MCIQDRNRSRCWVEWVSRVSLSSTTCDPSLISVLAAFTDLATADPRRLELHLRRTVGQGNAIIAAAERFPRFSIDISAEEPVALETSPPTFQVDYTISLDVQGELTPAAKKARELDRFISFLALLSDGPLVRFLRIR